MTYEIGKFYQVPCVRGQWHHLNRDWPVMGSLHEDGEVIGFKQMHYHIDWRFVARPWIDEFSAALKGLAEPISHNYIVPLITWRRMNPAGLPEPTMRRRKCHRAHSLPWESAHIQGRKDWWGPKLEAAYAGCKLGPGRICPHRGYDLSHEPVNDQGVVTCPCHGLRWNVFTGALAPHAKTSHEE